MLLVDTNVLAYLLIEGDRTRAVQTLYSKDPEWRSESFILVEFSNILATYCRQGTLTMAQAKVLLSEAESRMRGLVSAPNEVALEVANRFGISAYDARFLAAAEILGTPLLTEDGRLRAAAPKLTRSIADALADQ